MIGRKWRGGDREIGGRREKNKRKKKQRELYILKKLRRATLALLLSDTRDASVSPFIIKKTGRGVDRPRLYCTICRNPS